MGICSSCNQDKIPENDKGIGLGKILENKSEKFSANGVSMTPECLKSISMNNFEIMKVIGIGSTGKVYLVKEKLSNPPIYSALKVIDKQLATDQNLKIYLMNEKNILQYNECPFLAKLTFSFQSSCKLFLGMEYLSGGDLFYHLSKGVFFTESAVKFYAAEIVIAIDYLHSNSIIYRDLKPENILFEKDGHIKLVDFGLSKHILKMNSNICFTNCGSPEYVAPEVIRNEAYDDTVDWWSLLRKGVILYEVLMGVPPFYDPNPDVMIFNTLNSTLTFPRKISEDSKDLISKFLERTPTLRLGSGVNGVKEIQSHPFFENLNWNEISEKKMKPPFVPASSNRESEAGNFDTVAIINKD